MKRQVFLTIVGALVGLCFLCGTASGAVYWGDGTTIGRANLDGSYRLDGNGLGKYIGYNGQQAISRACGVAVDGSHIYWTDSGRGLIGRANLDGSDPSFTFIGGASEPCGIAVDGAYVYWANGGDSTIGRARLDGTEARQDFIDVPISEDPVLAGVSRLCGIAVNGMYIYWANWREGLIGRVSLDGKLATEDFVETGEYGPCGVAVNATNVFWGSYGDVIGRADLDGSNPDGRFITGLNRPCGVAVDRTRLHWIEESTTTNAIGHANLDGTSATRGVLTGIQPSCAIAVDSLFVSPPPPQPLPPPAPPLESPCKLGMTRHNRGKASASVAVSGPGRGRIKVLTRGLRWRVLKSKSANAYPRWRWIEVWPGREGRVAKRIRQRLGRDGRAVVKLRVRCNGRGLVPTTTARRMALLARRGA